MAKFDWKGRTELRARQVRTFSGYEDLQASITTKSVPGDENARWTTRLQLKMSDRTFSGGMLDLSSTAEEDDEVIADALEWLAQQIRTCR